MKRVSEAAVIWWLLEARPAADDDIAVREGQPPYQADRQHCKGFGSIGS